MTSLQAITATNRHGNPKKISKGKSRASMLWKAAGVPVWDLPLFYPSLIAFHGTTTIRSNSSTHTPDSVFKPPMSRRGICMVTTWFYYFLPSCAQRKSTAVTVFVWAMLLEDLQSFVCYSKMLVSQQPGGQTRTNKLFCLFPIAITSRWKPLKPLVQCYSSHKPNRSQCWKQITCEDKLWRRSCRDQTRQTPPPSSSLQIQVCWYQPSCFPMLLISIAALGSWEQLFSLLHKAGSWVHSN